MKRRRSFCVEPDTAILSAAKQERKVLSALWEGADITNFMYTRKKPGIRLCLICI